MAEFMQILAGVSLFMIATGIYAVGLNLNRIASAMEKQQINSAHDSQSLHS